MYVPSLYSISKLYAPKKQNLMVGTDVMRIDKSKPEPPLGKKVMLEDAVDFSSKALEAYGNAKNDGLPSFIATDKGFTLSLKRETSDGPLTVTIHDSKNLLKVLAAFEVDDDTRITFDDKGMPTVLKGKEALDTDGTLRAQNDGEILFRVNAQNVDGGSGKATIVNLSATKGAFTGGQGETSFWGVYENSTIKGGDGRNNFAGTFTDTIITGGNHYEGDDYSGVFSGSTLDGGRGNDIFSGLFLNNSVLNGNDGDDKFIGTFMESTLNGGASVYGNVYGSDPKVTGTDKPGEYNLGMQFYKTTINAGDRGDTFKGYYSESRLNGGKGNDTFKGFFDTSHIRGGDGHDFVQAAFANASIFDGDKGNDIVDIYSGRSNMVDGGEGSNYVGMGESLSKASWLVGLGGGQHKALSDPTHEAKDIPAAFDLMDGEVVYHRKRSDEGFAMGSGEGALIRATEKDVAEGSFGAKKKASWLSEQYAKYHADKEEALIHSYDKLLMTI